MIPFPFSPCKPTHPAFGLVGKSDSGHCSGCARERSLDRFGSVGSMAGPYADDACGWLILLGFAHAEGMRRGDGCLRAKALQDGTDENGARAGTLRDMEVAQIMTLRSAKYTKPEFEGKFRCRRLFLGANTRDAVADGRANYTLPFLSEIEDLIMAGALRTGLTDCSDTGARRGCGDVARRRALHRDGVWNCISARQDTAVTGRGARIAGAGKMEGAMAEQAKPDRGVLRVDVDECKGCMLCIEACPPRVIQMSERLNP